MKSGFAIYNEEDKSVQMMLVISNLALHQLVPSCLAIIRKGEQVNKVGLFFLDSLPGEVDDVLEAKSLNVKVRGLKGR